jgi:ubiquinone/menaquinone biosynthesis C-methylase UbiE
MGKEMGSNRHFEWLAPWYDRLLGKKDPDRLKRLVRIPAGGRLLDAGGGTGRIGELLRPANGLVVVADVSLGMLQQAQQKNGLSVLGAASEALPFPDGSFDAVVMVDALHHVANQGRTAAELYRVVRPGGMVVIEEPDYRRPAGKIVALLEKLAFMRSRFLTPQEIAALFRLPGARARLEWEGFNAWVIVEKMVAGHLETPPNEPSV